MNQPAFLRCSVITPEEQVLDADAAAVVLPAHDGMIGILRNRAPLLCELGMGPLRVDTTEGPREFFVDGGFAQVLENRVTVLSEKAIPVENLTRAEAEKALAAAEQLPAKDEQRVAARTKAIFRAKLQMRLARS